MIEFGWFKSHSGLQLPWKVDCDSFNNSDWENIGKIIRWKFAFSEVIGIPTGGTKLAAVLASYCEPNYPTLLVDDVLTTGKSMESFRKTSPNPTIGVVIFARGICPNWIWPVFTVNEWSQSRATGLG